MPKKDSKCFEFFTIISSYLTIYRIIGGFLNAATSILLRDLSKDLDLQN
jgi:hypothetical protein